MVYEAGEPKSVTFSTAAGFYERRMRMPHRPERDEVEVLFRSALGRGETELTR